MDLTLLLFGFALAVLMGAGLKALLVTVKPEWSDRRRILTAGSALAAITAVATLVGLLLIATAQHGQNQRTEELAIMALATIGGGFTLLALAGGMTGAVLAGRRRRQ